MDFAINLDQGEKILISALMRQERWAQKQLYEEYYGQMMGMCLRYGSSKKKKRSTYCMMVSLKFL